MCSTYSSPADVHSLRKRRVCCKQDFGPEEERAFTWLLDEYVTALDPVEDDIAAFVDDADDLGDLETIRAELQSRTGAYTGDFETVFREGGERGAVAGRTLAARRNEFDIAFDVVPEETLDILDEWSETAAESTLETITEDSARWLRGTYEEGLGVDDIADQLNDELFAGRLEDHVAERAARTATISSSNAGNHSAMQDAEGVIGEEWLTTLDGRERDTHANADGQIVAVGTSFEVGGVLLDHPGDPTGPLEEIANCRCTATPVFADDLTDDELESLQAGERLNT